MIPILYESNEIEFLSNGIGRLSDAVSCVVTEEKNGIYELQMSYPITGALFKSIVPGVRIKASNGSVGNEQVFDVYKISKPLNGIITIYAEHISYQLSKIVVSPYTASSVSDALGALKENASTDCPFAFWTDKVTNGDFSVDVPTSIRSKLGGTQGSILDVYGGTYEFDNYLVRLWNKRGQDKGVILRYGKNITDITQEENISNTITGVYPYWLGNEGDYFELSKKNVLSKNASNFPSQRIVTLDCSTVFETKPTAEEMEEYASKYLNDIKAGIPEVNISVSFINLAQTEEYKDVVKLENIGMCDTVSVYFEKLDISAVAEVVKTSYNVLKEKYDSVQVGEVRANLASNMAKQSALIKEKPSRSFMENAIHNATNLITGVDGGYVLLHQDGNGKPYEILIMDTEDIETATNVWRWNKNGWGHSSNGYNGPYTMAATLDGGFVADFITAGTMMANRIKGGTLTLGGKDNGNGIINLLNEKGQVVTTLTKDGMMIHRGQIQMSELAEESTPIEFIDANGRKAAFGPAGIELSYDDSRVRIWQGMFSLGKVNSDGTVTMNVYMLANGSIHSEGNIYARGSIQSQGAYDNTTTSAANVFVTYGGLFKRSASSSERYKTDITAEIKDDLNPQQLYELPVKTFKYKEGYLSKEDDKNGEDVIGFIVEDLEKVYPGAVQYVEGKPEMWNANVLIPAMLKLIQEQNERLKRLEERHVD